MLPNPFDEAIAISDLFFLLRGLLSSVMPDIRSVLRVPNRYLDQGTKIRCHRHLRDIERFLNALHNYSEVKVSVPTQLASMIPLARTQGAPLPAPRSPTPRARALRISNMPNYNWRSPLPPQVDTTYPPPLPPRNGKGKPKTKTPSSPPLLNPYDSLLSPVPLLASHGAPRTRYTRSPSPLRPTCCSPPPPLRQKPPTPAPKDAPLSLPKPRPSHRLSLPAPSPTYSKPADDLGTMTSRKQTPTPRPRSSSPPRRNAKIYSEKEFKELQKRYQYCYEHKITMV